MRHAEDLKQPSRAECDPDRVNDDLEWVQMEQLVGYEVYGEKEEHDFRDRAYDERNECDAELASSQVHGHASQLFPPASACAPVADGFDSVVDIPHSLFYDSNEKHVLQHWQRCPDVVH